ncbi:MAG: tetratricopeptide repeat protein [Patescibacteria group bacterium]|nr:tetratricopeptide repeat protein [Patescibacteria group bacterium]
MNLEIISRIKNKQRNILIFFAFVMLVLFYNWQLFTSNKYLSLGNDVYMNENYNQSLKNYKYAVVIDGDRDTVYTARIKRAEIFYEFGQFDEAEKEIYKAVDEKKFDFKAYELLGDVFYKKRDAENAIKYYQKAFDLSGQKSIKMKLARSFIAKGEIDKAKNIFSELFFEDSNNIEAIYYLGLFELYEKREYDNFFKKIEEKDDIFYNQKIDKIKEHIKKYDDGQNMNYNNLLISDLFLKINEPYLSIAKSKLILENNWEYRDAWIILGKANFIIGDYQESLKNFNNAYALDSNNSEIYFWLGSVYEKIGDDLKAKEFLEKIDLLEIRN